MSSVPWGRSDLAGVMMPPASTYRRSPPPGKSGHGVTRKNTDQVDSGSAVTRRASRGKNIRGVRGGASRYNPRMPRTGLIALSWRRRSLPSPWPRSRPPKPAAKPAAAASKLDALKQEAVADVESRSQFSQQMVDQIFSYGELGFQEFETNRYLIDVLEKNGFAVQEGIAGIPTAFMATWGSGKPVIALGSDIDCIPQASQKPGVA